MTERIHDLKCLAVYFDALESGEKTFDVRRDDRGYQKGDTLRLTRWDSSKNHYTRPRRIMERRIVYILTGGQFGIEPGYIVMSVEPI